MKKLVSFKHPRWRYGGYAFLVMAVVIAVAVLVNVGFDEMENRYAWRRDFSFNNLTTQSETTRDVLSALSYPVHMYVLYTPGQEDLAMMELIKRYQAASPLVTYEMLELNKNPGLLTKFQGDAENTITSDSLIVFCEITGRYKILSPESFSALGYSIESGEYAMELAYEKRITEALLYVTQDTIPEIMLLSGHGELGGEDVNSLTASLTGNNYAVRTVDIGAGETLDSGSLLMILSPRKDFTENEVAAITAFAKEGGSLYITCDFTDDLRGMDNYLALLRSYGMVPMDGVVLASAEEPDTYFGDKPLFLTPYMLPGEATDSLLAAGMDYLIMVGARAFETPENSVSGLTVSPVLASGYKAYLRDSTDGSTSPQQQDGDPVGPFSLALFSTKTEEDGTLSRAFILGNSTLLTYSQFYEVSYNLEFVLRMCERLLNQKPISLNILSKPYLRPGLKEVSLPAGIAVAVLLPLLVLFLSLIILLPRRHR